MPDTGLNESTETAAPGPPSLARIAGLIAALCKGEVVLARTALKQVRRSLLMAVPGLLIVGALLMVAIGQASFALVAGLQAAGLGPAVAHLGAALILMVMAGLVAWAVYRWFSQAISAVQRVLQSLRADLKMLLPPETEDHQN